MNNKNKLPLLLGIFGILLAAVLVYVYLHSGKSASNYDPQLVDTDTAQVTRIAVSPKSGGEAFELLKSGTVWNIMQSGRQFKADSAAVRGILAELASVRAQRVAATGRQGWDAYQLSDTAATRVEAYRGNTMLYRIYIGSFSFKQSQDPYQRQPVLRSHIRVDGDERVYAVDGMISMAFNRRAADMRSQQLLRIDPDLIDRVEINTAEGVASLLRYNNNWTVDGIPADSSLTGGYIKALAHTRCAEWSDADLSGRKPASAIIISTGRGNYTIKAFTSPDGKVLLTSSTDPETVFQSDSTGLYQRLFRPASYFAQVP